jgi:hypothetical protein
LIASVTALCNKKSSGATAFGEQDALRLVKKRGMSFRCMEKAAAIAGVSLLAILSHADGQVQNNGSSFSASPVTRSQQGSREIRDTMLEKEAARKAQNLEEAAHPFWNAGFWKSPPARLIGMFLGGDQHRLNTPLTHREKLAGAEYPSEGEIKKFENEIKFGQSAPKGEVIVGAVQRRSRN